MDAYAERAGPRDVRMDASRSASPEPAAPAAAQDEGEMDFSGLQEALLTEKPGLIAQADDWVHLPPPVFPVAKGEGTTSCEDVICVTGRECRSRAGGIARAPLRVSDEVKAAIKASVEVCDEQATYLGSTIMTLPKGQTVPVVPSRFAELRESFEESQVQRGRPARGRSLVTHMVGRARGVGVAVDHGACSENPRDDLDELESEDEAPDTELLAALKEVAEASSSSVAGAGAGASRGQEKGKGKVSATAGLVSTWAIEAQALVPGESSDEDEEDVPFLLRRAQLGKRKVRDTVVAPLETVAAGTEAQMQGAVESAGDEAEVASDVDELEGCLDDEPEADWGQGGGEGSGQQGVGSESAAGEIKTKSGGTKDDQEKRPRKRSRRERQGEGRMRPKPKKIDPTTTTTSTSTSTTTTTTMDTTTNE